MIEKNNYNGRKLGNCVFPKWSIPPPQRNLWGSIYTMSHVGILQLYAVFFVNSTVFYKFSLLFRFGIFLEINIRQKQCSNISPKTWSKKFVNSYQSMKKGIYLCKISRARGPFPPKKIEDTVRPSRVLLDLKKFIASTGG